MKWSGRGGGGDGVGGKQFIFPRWFHPANITMDENTMANFYCNQFIFPRWSHPANITMDEITMANF